MSVAAVNLVVHLAVLSKQGHCTPNKFWITLTCSETRASVSALVICLYYVPIYPLGVPQQAWRSLLPAALGVAALP